MQRLMKILEEPISGNGVEKLMSLQRDFLANPSARQEKEKARQMTVISGRKCCEQLMKSGPLGLLARMLLESPQWYCPVRKLQWQTTQICSERITYKQKQQSSSYLSESVKILKQLDMNCSRLLFRLAVLELPTEGTDFGFLHAHFPHQSLLCQGRRLLPTPQRRDYRKGSLIQGMRVQRKLKQGWTLDLNDLAVNQLLPTPTTSMETVQDMIQANYSGNNRPPYFLYSPTGKISHLSPLYVSEVMGYPTNYLLLPFQSGARKQ